MMNPTINNNGDTRQTLVDTRLTFMRWLNGAVEAHMAMVPHGRNYQGPAGSNEQYWADRELWQSRHNMLKQLYADIHVEAAAIKRGDG